MIKKQINEFITKDIGTLNGFNRDKWIKDSLSSLPKGSSILDAGAGESKYKKFCGHLKYTSQDIAEYDGQGDGYGIQTQTRDYSNLDIISDITSIPVEDGSFDSVMCIEVFEHLPWLVRIQDQDSSNANRYISIRSGVFSQALTSSCPTPLDRCTYVYLCDCYDDDDYGE
mgnify:CR=1 FL=1